MGHVFGSHSSVWQQVPLYGNRFLSMATVSVDINCWITLCIFGWLNWILVTCFASSDVGFVQCCMALVSVFMSQWSKLDIQSSN